MSIAPANFKHPHVTGMAVDPAFSDVAWSPAGNEVALGSNYDTVYIVNIQCNDATHICSSQRIGSTTCCVNGSLSWSPDGTKLAAICYQAAPEPTSDFKICIIDSHGKIVKEFPKIDLTTEQSLVLGSPVWSPDGKKIAFSDGAHILVVAVDTKSVFDVTSNLDIRPDSPPQIAWLP
jgi:Tol biopolymer transport system component